MIRALLILALTLLLLLRASAQDQQLTYLPLVSNNNIGPQVWASYLPSVSITVDVPLHGYCGTAHGAPVECQECEDGTLNILCYDEYLEYWSRHE